MNHDRTADLKKLTPAQLAERARTGDRAATLEYVTRAVIEAAETRPRDSSATTVVRTSARLAALAEDLVRFVPPLETRDVETFAAYWRLVIRSTLRGANERLLAKRREVAAARPFTDDTTMLLDPPRAAVTSVSRVTAKSDEYARIRALLPLLKVDDEETYLRGKLLGEPAADIAGDLGIPAEKTPTRLAKAYQRLLALISRTREGRIDEVLREHPMADDSKATLADPSRDETGSRLSRDESGSNSRTPPLAVR